MIRLVSRDFLIYFFFKKKKVVDVESSMQHVLMGMVFDESS